MRRRDGARLGRCEPARAAPDSAQTHARGPHASAQATACCSGPPGPPDKARESPLGNAPRPRAWRAGSRGRAWRHGLRSHARHGRAWRGSLDAASEPWRGRHRAGLVGGGGGACQACLRILWSCCLTRLASTTWRGSGRRTLRRAMPSTASPSSVSTGNTESMNASSSTSSSVAAPASPRELAVRTCAPQPLGAPHGLRSPSHGISHSAGSADT